MSAQSDSDLLKSILKSGASISKSHLKNRNGCSVILPPCYYPPNKFYEKMCPEVEREICVYYILEELQEDFIVLHNFSLTHHQHGLFVKHDCNKEDEEEDSDLDYLVIHNKSISTIKVEATICDSEDKFFKSYTEAKASLEKISKLNVAASLKFNFIETQTVHQFIVFPSINRKYAEDNLMCYVSLSPEEKQCVLFKDEIENQEFLTNCLKGKPMFRLQIKNKIKWLLIGLWSMNIDNEPNVKRRTCDFGKSGEDDDPQKSSGKVELHIQFCLKEGLKVWEDKEGVSSQLESNAEINCQHGFTDELENNLNNTQKGKKKKQSVSDEKLITPPHEDFIRNIMRVGVEISSIYCHEKTKRPIMLPPAPLCKFIDKYPNNIENEPNWVQQIEKQQREYEAEVKVYRAIEDVRENMIVLHGFRFTHQQYNLFVEHDCTKKDMDEEGEIDFLVINDKLVTLIEVKSTSCDSEEKFINSYRKAQKQQAKSSKLVRGVDQKCNVIEVITIHQIIVFTSITRKYAEENLDSYNSLTRTEKLTILFKNDIEYWALISHLLVIKFETKVDIKTKWILLGLWCMNNKNDKDFVTNSCDLGKSIQRVDHLLRTSEITSSLKSGNRSPLVKIAPRIFQDYLKIKCLTVSQLAIFESKQNKLCIRGPAGSGKTILIMAKVIEMVKLTNKNVAIIVLNKATAETYSKILTQSGLKTTLWGDVRYKSLKSKKRVLIKYFQNRLKDLNLGDMKTYPVVEVNEKDRCSSLTLLLKSDYHIFIDDFHGFTTGIGSKTDREFKQVLAEFESKSRSRRTFWIVNDILQQGFLYDYTKKHKNVKEFLSRLNPDSIRELSDNLRNSYEITHMLSEIKNMRSNPANTMFIEQQPGHFIHGPKGNLHFMHSLTPNGLVIKKLVIEVILKELKKLKNTDLAIIVADDRLLASDSEERVNLQDPLYTHYMAHLGRNNQPTPDSITHWEQICKDITSDFLASPHSRRKNRINVISYEDSFSAEWPAVIGILEWGFPEVLNKTFTSEDSIEEMMAEWYDQLLARMYITVSRARVYCSVIIIMKHVQSFINDLTMTAKANNIHLVSGTVTEFAKRKIAQIMEDIENVFQKYFHATSVSMRFGSKTPYFREGDVSELFSDFKESHATFEEIKLSASDRKDQASFSKAIGKI